MAFLGPFRENNFRKMCYFQPLQRENLCAYIGEFILNNWVQLHSFKRNSGLIQVNAHKGELIQICFGKEQCQNR